jgi:cation transport ATPase
MNYQIVHSVAGRLRIRVPRLARDEELASKLTWLVESLTEVTGVRINAAAMSLVITYCPDGISDEVMQSRVITCLAKADQVEPANFPNPALKDTETGQETAESEVTELEPEVNHWQDLGMPLLSLGVALAAAPLELPALVVVAAIAGAAMPWFRRARDSLVNHGKPNIDLLDSLWMSLQTLQGNYAAPALKTCMVEARRSLRGTTAASREQEAQELLHWFEQQIWVEREGQSLYIAINAIQSGDRLRLKTGDRIPVDGWVLEGTALLDERHFAENSFPVVCTEGQAVYATTRLLEGELYILAERAGFNSRMGLVAQLIQQMPVHDTQIGVKQAQFLEAVIYPTILFGGAMFALTGNFGAAVSPFQLDFGSGVPISVHTTLLSALTYAAQHGIYIRSARVLELLTEVDVVVFDQSSLVVSAGGTDCLRWGSDAAIAELHRQKLETFWVSSASLSICESLGNQMGITADCIMAGATLEDAAELVSALRHQGKTVAFVGDSRNQAARSEASVSISFATDQEMAQIAADVVLLDDNLEGLHQAIAIARRAMEVVYQNTAIIVLPNLLIQIGGGMMLGVNPVINVITNNSSAFVAEFVHGARPLFDRYTPAPVKLRSQPSRPQLSEGMAALFPTHPLSSLKQIDLAKRLGVAYQALTARRLKPEFTRWTQDQDPEGKAWRYDSQSRLFYALEI